MPKLLLLLLSCVVPAACAATAAATATAKSASASAAASASASASQSAGEKSAQPRYASREELRSCMEGEEQIKQRNAQLERSHTRHNAELKALQDQSAAFYATEDKVDASDEKQVAAFNAHVAELNQQVDALNQRGLQLTEEVKQFRADMRVHNQHCAALVYRIIDRDSVLRERKRGKNASKD